MARYWVISSFLIGVISLNITPWNCVITKKSPKFVYNNVVRGAAVMFYKFIATLRPLLNFSKHSSGLYPPDQLSSARSVFLRWRAEFTTSAPFCTPPVFPAGYFGLWRWQKRGIALSPHTRACKLYGGRGANRRWCPPGVAWADIWIASDVTRGTRCYPCSVPTPVSTAVI